MLLGFEGDCFCNFTVLFEIRLLFLVFGAFGKDRCTADSLKRLSHSEGNYIIIISIRYLFIFIANLY